VEIDETYVGGVRKYGVGRPMRGDKKKTPVVGLVERGGRIVAVAADNVGSKELSGIVRQYVMPKSTIFTDEHRGYDPIKHMPGMGYRHRRIKHSAGVYVKGNVHTNTIGGFWSLVKNGMRGVYHSVGKKYLQSYLNEYSFRYNRRASGNLIFWAILGRVCELASESHAAQAPQNQTT